MTDATLPQDLYYTKTHEWIRIVGDIWTLGITDHAQGALTDIVFCEVIASGAVPAGAPLAEVESIKTAAEVYAPVACEVVEANPKVEEAPETMNSDPYGEGWIVRIKVGTDADTTGLLDAAGYAASIS